MVIQETPYNTKRIFLYRSEFPQNLTILNTAFIALDALSIWGGCDKKADDFMSWEFDLNIPDCVLEMFCKRFKFNLKGDRDV